MKVTYTRLCDFKDCLELDLLHPDFVNAYRVEFERISKFKCYPSRFVGFELSLFIGGFNATFEDFVAINSAILEHNIPQIVVEKFISHTFITQMRNMLKAYLGKFKTSEVEVLRVLYNREIISIRHKSWVYVFDNSL